MLRSPSPEPIYNYEGKRLNTRDLRYRKKLEDERHANIQEMLSLYPTYVVPADYRVPEIKLQDKIYIPYGLHCVVVGALRQSLQISILRSISWDF